MPLRYKEELLKKYQKEVQYIKAIKGKDYTVTIEDLKHLLNIQEQPWSDCLGFTVR